MRQRRGLVAIYTKMDYQFSVPWDTAPNAPICPVAALYGPGCTNLKTHYVRIVRTVRTVGIILYE